MPLRPRRRPLQQRLRANPLCCLAWRALQGLPGRQQERLAVLHRRPELQLVALELVRQTLPGRPERPESGFDCLGRYLVPLYLSLLGLLLTITIL